MNDEINQRDYTRIFETIRRNPTGNIRFRYTWITLVSGAPSFAQEILAKVNKNSMVSKGEFLLLKEYVLQIISICAIADDGSVLVDFDGE
ncbi:hypothetical protein [Mesorhizobium amorphae]|uniref:hypothetical protein n=1 Tax=Mesorhizobium amorphae TaxID=71433 RepID=UPI001781F1B6|nr:hypothetical protein [Mesorhizobium amorphae]